MMLIGLNCLVILIKNVGTLFLISREDITWK